jgi:hypothetical protein
MPNLIVAWNYVRAVIDLDDRRDHGVITTEMAVVIFLLVAGAIAIVGILVTAATNNANNVPVPGS